MNAYLFRITCEHGEKLQVDGVTEERSFVAAYRKISGDHADLLIRDGTELCIDLPDGGSVTFVTVENVG